MDSLNISSTIAALRSSGQVSQLYSVVAGIGRMFYLHDTSDTSFESVDQVPNFFRNAWPYFLAFILLENIILWLEKKPTVRLNDSITSLSHGLIQECGRLVFRGGESALYIYIYDNYRIADLPWDSPWTWYTAAISVDFCYYWVHRASHEVHILWAQHQVHHSSEDYNLSVGLRQSIFQGWCGFIFYIPMALFVPPAHFITHQQFSLIYQFWIHTDVIQSLGPLEHIFNTPQHHRVHHGCNLYCLDRNYGGFLIIWDKMFGTFAAEMKKVPIVYGLVFNQPSFNPFFLQVFYNQHVVEKIIGMSGWRNKVSAVIKGPSWLPGKKWTGADEDKIDVQPREKYDVSLPTWCNLYLVVHFVFVLVGFQELALRYLSMTPVIVIICVAYVILSLTAIGMLFDNHPHAAIFELTRCIIFLVIIHYYDVLTMSYHSILLIKVFYMFSSVFWSLYTLNIIQIKCKLP